MKVKDPFFRDGAKIKTVIRMQIKYLQSRAECGFARRKCCSAFHTFK